MSVKPRLTYGCPKCKQLILRLYTAAQLDDAAWPVAVHRGVELGDRILDDAASRSASLEGFRANGFEASYVAAGNQDDIAVSCRNCGGKYSVPVAPLLADLRAGAKTGGILPTRRG